MTSQNNVPRKVEFKTRTNLLRRSVSTTNIGELLAEHLNLRDSKSYTGKMQGNKSDSSEDNEVSTDKLREETYKNIVTPLVNKIIETRDAATDEIVKIESGMLHQGGKTYTLNEIAHIWKKDCRIWLWKNCKDFKKSRSVGEKMKSGLIKIKDYAI